MADTMFIIFNNEYTCESCGTTWSDTWSGCPDDDCPNCGESTSPDEIGNFEYVTEDELPKGVEAYDCQTVGPSGEHLPSQHEIDEMSTPLNAPMPA